MKTFTILVALIIMGGCTSMSNSGVPSSRGYTACKQGDTLIVHKTGSRIRTSSNNVPHRVSCARRT